MVDAALHIAEAPTLELFRTSRRFWFRNDAVACGLLPDTDGSNAGPRYWKWNRRLEHCRITPMARDKKLFSDPLGLQACGIQPGSVLSYKPESRLAWRQDAARQPLFCKVYRQTTFDHAVEGAKWLKALGAAPQLCGIDHAHRTIRWEWIDGNPPAATAPVQMLLELVQELHQAKHPAESCLPRLGSETIRRHLKERIEAFSAWLPILLPDKIEDLHFLGREFEVLDRRLDELPVPRHFHLIHGDLRRRNVLVDHGGNPKLLDSDHVAFGDREWDCGAWVADASTSDDRLGHDQLEALKTNAQLKEQRLSVYTRVWRLLITLKEIEEQTG